MARSQGEVVEKKKCFVIAPIGSAGTETRLRSDQILKYVIIPVVSDLGYEARRADGLDQSGMITTQILNCIMEDALVIADLTDQNPNVFYELAVRHAIRKPFVQLIAEGEKIPFDVQGLRTISIDHRDLDSVAAAKEQLRNTVQAIEGGAPVETPLSVSLNLQDLRSSGNAEEQGISQILQVMEQLRQDFKNGPGRASPPSVSVHDLSVVRAFLLGLAKEGRLTNRDIQALVGGSGGSKGFKDWASNELADALDEAPF